MYRKVVLSFVLAALAIGSAKTRSYSVTLHFPAMIGATELKAGDYKLEVDDQKAVLRNGKVEAAAPVKVETNGQKYDTTTVRFQNGDGKMHIHEIRLGGTSTKLVFEE